MNKRTVGTPPAAATRSGCRYESREDEPSRPGISGDAEADSDANVLVDAEIDGNVDVDTEVDGEVVCEIVDEIDGEIDGGLDDDVDAVIEDVVDGAVDGNADGEGVSDIESVGDEVILLDATVHFEHAMTAMFVSKQLVISRHVKVV